MYASKSHAFGPGCSPWGRVCMTNIPTDLLRTLVAVVDLRSYTKAANSLGVTQPAVIARARRLLSLNDEIVGLGAATVRADLIVRIGTPSDYVATMLPGILAQFRSQHPDVRFVVRSDFYEPLLRQLHMGEIDLLAALSPTRPPDARHSQALEMLWVRGEVPLDIDPA